VPASALETQVTNWVCGLDDLLQWATWLIGRFLCAIVVFCLYFWVFLNSPCQEKPENARNFHQKRRPKKLGQQNFGDFFGYLFWLFLYSHGQEILKNAPGTKTNRGNKNNGQ
jgi:hypothetical protein